MKSVKLLPLGMLLAALGCGSEQENTSRPQAAAAAPAAPTVNLVGFPAELPRPPITNVVAPAPPPPIVLAPIAPPPPIPAGVVAQANGSFLTGDSALKEIIQRAEAVAKSDVTVDNGITTVRFDYKDGSRSIHRKSASTSEYEFHPAK